MRDTYHWYQQDDKKAEILLTEEGFEVDLFLDDKLVETREIHDHSESYAESLAENWVLGVIPVPQGYKGYYGYNEKTDNYDPEIDD